LALPALKSSTFLGLAASTSSMIISSWFVNGISTEKYVNLCRVSRATAYRELKALCEMGVLVLVQTGTGRGTRYKLGPLS
jgi:Fic family protein